VVEQRGGVRPFRALLAAALDHREQVVENVRVRRRGVLGHQIARTFSTWTPTPNRAPKATTERGSSRIAFRSSASKYLTSPALDISPPEF
jgi:hypothetical protein